MLDDYNNGLPNMIATLQKEHDRIQVELNTELAISRELDLCDPADLEDLRQELEAQR